MLLSSSLRNSIVESSGGPVFEKRELHHVNKHIEVKNWLWLIRFLSPPSPPLYLCVINSFFLRIRRQQIEYFKYLWEHFKALLKRTETQLLLFPYISFCKYLKDWMAASTYWLYYENRIKKHLEQAYLFEKSLVKSYSECDYVVKFWGPLVEKVFKTTSIIPHW